MRRALGGKLKLEFIDGTNPIVSDPFDPSFRAWNRCNMLVHSWIMNSVSDSIAQSLVFMENALDVWNDLKERFAQADLIRISEIQQEIYALKQDSRFVTEFYSDLKLLWEELEIYMPIPNCSCRQRCTCEAMRAARNNHNLLYIIRFLTGLNESFAMVKSQILLIDPLPPMNNVFSMVLQHERQLSAHISDDSKILINAAKYRGSSSSSFKPPNRVCTLCGKDNHIVENCFKKHGLPPHFRKASSSNNAMVEGGFDDTAGATESTIGSNTITQDQALQLISLLQSSFPNSNSDNASSSKAGSNEFTGHTSVNPGNVSGSSNACSLGNWILDSGASHHICNTVQWFHSYNEITPIRVKLPNGNHVFAKQSGIVKFSSSLILTDVLCVPNFSVNLLSVSQLCKNSKYILQFNDNQCSIQDTATKMMIGFADGIEGLYYLVLQDDEVHIHAAEGSDNIIPNQALWHFRLGHPSLSRLHSLHSKFPYITVDDKGVCDVCHLARQKKIPMIPTPLLNHKSPFELLHNEIPDLLHLKVFGSLTYASTLQAHRTKLEPRGRKCIFLGYKQGVKGTILYDLNSKEIFVSRNVTHHDHILPYTSPTSPKWHYHLSFSTHTPPSHSEHISQDHSPTLHPSSPLTDIIDSDITDQSSPPSTIEPSLPHNSPSSVSDTAALTPNVRPSRARHAPNHLSDYVCNHSIASSKSSHSACKFDCWKKAMNDELEALTKTGTWTLVDLPPLAKPIGSKWVYKIKYRADGTIERYKARLVAKGYNQIEGLDFIDTFSPVAKLTTVRTLLAIASIKHWHLHQLDVNNAFLHGELTENVYMHIPDGVVPSKPGQVCKLLKSLYGLKQASRMWYEKLTSLLIHEGYTQSSADYSLFTLHSASDFTAILVYVDDIILAGTSIAEFDRIKGILDSQFKIKDLGTLKYFLGLEVAQSREGINISQRKYCLDLLHDSGLLGAKPSVTPLDPAIKLYNDDAKPYDDISSYRRLVGKLLYLTNTRPDIAYATQQLSQFLHKPTWTHYNAACRVVKYLKQNPGRGLLFPRASDLQLLGFSDADWAGCVDTRRSTTGYCFFIGSSLISWKAKKQLTVSRSSSEAEYRALSSTTCELIWLLSLINDLKIQCDKPPVIYCDSQSAMHIASNPVFHERTKHLEIDCHLVREKVQQGILRLLPISTQDQLADCLTKALPGPKFSSIISKLGLKDIYHPKLEGGC
ncbi:hypothetical protein TSUD_222930 [Trifolium subterraneum]|uniref:Reverse transcriptase Ty1/copia-type domain-containing protein n=1 Tax=Trifolium subterraneum TaxID=3900 RepID=A0A2Z6NBP3_TRISU|nr:hypothetical protein TSUD_222930 [Trifolium subterraneum]